MTAVAHAQPVAAGLPGGTARRRMPRWLGDIFPFVLMVGWAFAEVQRVNRTILPDALALAAAAGLGLTSGLASRWSLRGRAVLLAVLVMLASQVVGLLLLGLLTDGSLGVSPAESRTTPDWNGLAQLAAAAVSGTLALTAWSRPRPFAPPGEVMPVAPVPVAARTSTRPRSRIRARVRARLSALGLGRRRRNARPHGRLGRRHEPRSTTATSVRPARHRRGRFGRARSGKVHLARATRHVCPYCLERVVARDPRGVVTCSTCRTPHHADCWAVAGACQVPHYHG